MKRVVVRYRLKADRVAEHEALLLPVFEELERSRPEGLSYEAMKLADGVSYVHIATLAGPENPLVALASFKAFSADIRARCEEPPAPSDGTLVGSYRVTRE